MDKYDRAIEVLAKDPDRIKEAWLSPCIDGAGCLFRYLTPTGTMETSVDYGCLTQIKAFEEKMAWTRKLTDQIKADDRIPKDVPEITIESLPVFAEYQRLADRLFRNTQEAV